MSLSITEIVKLAQAGFTAETISLLDRIGGTQSQDQLVQTNVLQHHQTQTPIVQEHVQQPPIPQAPAAQNTVPTDPQSQAAYIKALQDLNLRLVNGQMPTQEQTAEDILAGIINPPTQNSQGGAQ